MFISQYWKGAIVTDLNKMSFAFFNFEIMCGFKNIKTLDGNEVSYVKYFY